MFLSGALFRRLSFQPTRLHAAVAVAALAIYPLSWELALATGGAFLLLTFGLRPSSVAMPDISYGTYLYGWPIQMLLIWWGMREPVAIFLIALPAALLCGLASWYGVERWALKLKASRAAIATHAALPQPHLR